MATTRNQLHDALAEANADAGIANPPRAPKITRAKVVTARNQLQDVITRANNDRVRAGLKLAAVLVSLILLAAYGPKAIAGTGHQAKGLWQRVTGSHQPEAMSWDSVKEWASSQGKVLPAPTKTQLVRSKATNTPIEQIQAQDLLQHVQQTLYKQQNVAKTAASDAAAAAAGKVGDLKDAAGTKAGEYVDAVKGRTLPKPSFSQRLWSTITRKPVVQTQAEGLYGDLKGRASDAAAAGQQKAGEAVEGVRGAIPDVGGAYDDLKGRASDAVTSGQQKVGDVKGCAADAVASAQQTAGDLKDRASGAAAYGQQKAGETVEGARSAVTPPKEGTWAWLKRAATGRSRAQVHYDAAKDSAGDATGHLSQAASEAYEAVKAAGSVASSGAASAYHADPAGKASQATKDAAGTAYDSAKSYVDAAGSGVRNAKDAVSSRIEAGKQKVGEVFETTTEAVGNTASHARAEASLAAEKARHRVEEEAQKLKHTGQENLHAAKAEL